MNSSDSGLPDSESFGPDQYEVEITESHRFVDATFNDTNNNFTSSFQGKRIASHSFNYSFNHLSLNQRQQETK